MRVVLLGTPGAGNGTQAAKELGTATGLDAAEIMQRGELVPDNLIVSLAADRVDQRDAANCFVLDGFPRTLAQAEARLASLILSVYSAPLLLLLALLRHADCVAQCPLPRARRKTFARTEFFCLTQSGHRPVKYISSRLAPARARGQRSRAHTA